MALIVLQHSTVDAFDVDPDFAVTSNNRILAGTIVGINSDGYVSFPNNSASGIAPLGIAGDSISNEYQTTAYSAELVISPTGATRWTGNRVSDMFNETIASGKITVYFGSGKFATDQFAGGDNFYPGRALYSTSGGIITTTAGSNGLSRVIGFVAAAPAEYPSGVPGVDSPSVDNSMSLGRYLKIHLNVHT